MLEDRKRAADMHSDVTILPPGVYDRYYALEFKRANRYGLF